MPSFLSKVFGRKKDEKGSSPVRGRGYDGASLLEGKFEVVSLVGSPTTDEFPENAHRSKRKQKDSRLSVVNSRPSRSSSPGPSDRRDGFPQLPLSLPLSREEAQARALGTDFEGYTDAQFLSDVSIGDRRLSPLEALILVRICSQAIVARGLETLGLMHPYWHSASPETQHRLISLFIRSLNDNSPRSSADPSSFSLFESEINYTLSPHDVAAVLRWGLRHLELGPGGFGNEKTWYLTFAEAERKAGYPPQTYSETLTPLIPAPHLELLDATLDLFSSLAAHSEENSTSASKLTRAFGYWLLIAQRDRERDEWANFYDRWQSSGRILEHLFLARIRNESLRSRMPTRLTGLVARYPYVEGDMMEDDIFLHLQLSTRQFEALLVRVESELHPREHRHPLQLVKDALAAPVTNVDDNELVSFWERIKKSGNDESEVTPGGYPGIGRIFTDDTLRYLSLVPGNHPWKKSTATTFNLREVQGSPIFRRLATSPGPSEDLNRHTNGHTKYTSDPASPAPTGTSALSGDWFQFSSAGFTDASPSAFPLASTLFGQDVEKTNPPVRNKRPAKIRSRSPSRAPKSNDSAVSPAPPVPPVPDLPQLYSQKPTFKSTPTSLVEIDEAFVDFWVDALLDPVSSNWPKFVLCKLRPDLPVLQVNNQRVEYIIIEHFSGSFAPASMLPSSTVPMNIPPKSLEHNDLARTTSPTKSIPSSPRSSKYEKQRFFNLFSSTSGGGNNTPYALATTSRGKKHRETASSPPERDVNDFGEMIKEKDGKSSSVVKLRMPSPKPRRSVDATRRAEDLRGSNVDVSDQVRGRSVGEKGLEKLKESERKRKEAEEKIMKEAEKKREAEEKKRETEEKKKREAEDKKREAEEKKRETEEKKREAEEKKKRETEEKKREVEEKKREAEERKRKEAEEKKREVEERKRKEAEEKKRKDGSQGISSIAASAVAAAAVAVATVTTGGSQQATSQEDADTTDDIRSVEQRTEETASEQGLEEEEAEITPVDSEVTNFEEQSSRVLETIIESPTATEATHGPTGQTFSAPFQQAQDAKKAAVDHFFELGVVEESAIQSSAPREPEIRAVAEPVGEAREILYGNVPPETLAVVIEELVSSKDEGFNAKPPVIQATLKPIAIDEYAVVEEPAAFLLPIHEPQIAVAQEPEGAAVVSEPLEEVSPKPNAAESAGTVATPLSRPDVVAPVVEESTKVAGAAAEGLIAVEASLAVPKPVTVEGFLIIEGPAAFDPSDIDAQIEELNAQTSEETGDSDSASEEESSAESVTAEERLPFDAVELTPIHEADENEPSLAEDSFEDVVVVEEPAEETTLTPSVPSVAELSIPIQAAEILVAEEKDNVLFAEEDEQVAEAEAEAAPVKEEPNNEIVMITELSEKPSSTPILEPPSLATDELHEMPTAKLEKPTFVDVVEETEPPIQDLSSEAAVAVEAAPLVEEYTIVEEGVVVTEAVPVEEEHLAEAVVLEEDQVSRVPTEKNFVPSGPAQAVVSLDEHYSSEDSATVEDTEAVKCEKLVTGGVSDEPNSYDVAGDQPATVEEIVDAPAEGELSVYQSTVAVSAPVEYDVIEEPEIIEEPPADKQVDQIHAIEVIKRSSAEGFLAPVAETPAVTPEDTTEFIEAEESAVVDEPLITDYATEPAKDPVAEASATEEPPGSVKEPSTPPLAEAANPQDVLESPALTIDLIPKASVSEIPLLGDKVSLPQPIDATSVIDDDATDAAAKVTELAATPATTAVVEDHERMTTYFDEPSASTFDNEIATSNGDAIHARVSGVVNGNGLHAIITEKEKVSEEGAKPELSFTPAQGPEVIPFELPKSVPALAKED